MAYSSVLVVDDEPDNFDVIESLLSDRPYQLHYVSNGIDALESLDLFQPDVILLDVMMPGLDGIEVCARIKAMPNWHTVPIVIVTALTEKKDLARCMAAGADDFITKPINGNQEPRRKRTGYGIRSAPKPKDSDCRLFVFAAERRGI